MPIWKLSSLGLLLDLRGLELLGAKALVDRVLGLGLHRSPCATSPVRARASQTNSAISIACRDVQSCTSRAARGSKSDERGRAGAVDSTSGAARPWPLGAPRALRAPAAPADVGDGAREVGGAAERALRPRQRHQAHDRGGGRSAPGIDPAAPLGALLTEARGTRERGRSARSCFLAHRAGLDAHRALYAPLLRGAAIGSTLAAALREAADARRPDAAPG